MSFNLTTAEDPLNTSMERAAAAAGFPNISAFNRAMEAREWAALSAEDRAAIYELHQAEAMNRQWDALLRVQERPWQFRWNGSDNIQVPWTDDEKAAERQRFQGNPALTQRRD